jgi:hypothetical protein
MYGTIGVLGIGKNHEEVQSTDLLTNPEVYSGNQARENHSYDVKYLHVSISRGINVGS